MKEKSRPRGLPKKLAGCGRLFSLFECLGVLVMRVSENSKIRRICISGALFLFYASRFFQCGIIVLDLSAFYEFMCKNPAPKCGIFACIFFVNASWRGRRDLNYERPTLTTLKVSQTAPICTTSHHLTYQLAPANHS